MSTGAVIPETGTLASRMRNLNVPVLGDAVPRRGNAFSSLAGKCLLRIRGWDLAGSVPNVSKAVFIVAPHTSNWDFLVGVATVFAMGLRASFLGKHTLFKWPLGSMMRWLGGVPVDRRGARGVVDETVGLFAAAEKLILGLSPEGTRSSVDRWKSGFYYIAMEAGVPIVPVAFDYDRRLIRFGERFDPTGDLEADLSVLEGFYSGIEGRRRYVMAEEVWPQGYGDPGSRLHCVNPSTTPSSPAQAIGRLGDVELGRLSNTGPSSRTGIDQARRRARFMCGDPRKQPS